jgi:hypothetical protein
LNTVSEKIEAPSKGIYAAGTPHTTELIESSQARVPAATDLGEAAGIMVSGYMQASQY